MNNMSLSLPPSQHHQHVQHQQSQNISHIQQQINEAQEQISESEANLAAQHQVLLQQQQMLIEDAIRQVKDENLARMANEFNVDLIEFENILQPIIETCKKEAIAVCK
jgi:calcium homeostasis ER protein